MSYTSPTILPSGSTFAQLQSQGFAGHAEAVISANAFSEDVKTRLRHFARGTGDGQVKNMASHLTNYLCGNPTPTAEVNTQMLNLATALKALLASVEEVATLIAANTGTVSTVASKSGTHLATKRTFP